MKKSLCVLLMICFFLAGAMKSSAQINQFGDTIRKSDKTALWSGVSTIASGLIVKFLTKKASYTAVDIFNGIAVKKIKDIFSIRPASENYGMGLYVKL